MAKCANSTDRPAHPPASSPPLLNSIRPFPLAVPRFGTIAKPSFMKAGSWNLTPEKFSAEKKRSEVPELEAGIQIWPDRYSVWPEKEGAPGAEKRGGRFLDM